MENSVRSQRTRDAAIAAALRIISRDGPSRLTIDGVARESGISKGGVLHQFRTKEAVLRALIERQIEQSNASFHRHLDELPPGGKEPVLNAQIRTLQIATDQPEVNTLALAGAFAENPELIALIRGDTGERVDVMRQQAPDTRIALLRWSAAQGIALSSILGICPLSETERSALFAFLQDEKLWDRLTTPLASETTDHGLPTSTPA